ncbi:PepSY domain-containing protein [Paenibacillus piscarius]|uniref:PepSY domain-containing protein n=1 Tax=Paenibacillus piscarius TaxID=1089681 RepID=UPI001EE7AA8C|nr:PepSY domain-containing protein [Paenibacillus piscarius]
MKKKIWSSIAAAALILGGAYGIGEVQGGSTAEAAPTVKSQGKALIGVAKAEAVALKAAPGQVESIELEKKAGSTYYDIEIQQTRQEMDVRVDAYTGKVISVREDKDDDDDRYAEAAAPGGKLITAGRAAEAAQAAVKGTVTDVDLDRDRGTAVYEVEIRNGKNKTEVGVDAYTAKIIYTDVDSDDDDD